MKTILIADDDPQIVSSLSAMLQPYFAVHTSRTGIGVLRALSSQIYWGLIIDVDFGPGVDGLEIVSHVRRNNIDLRIIVFSAFNYTELRHRILQLGAVYCEKPLTAETVLGIFSH